MSNNYVQKATGSSPTGLVDSLIFDNGTNVGIGTTSPGTSLQVSGANINFASGENGVLNVFSTDAASVNKGGSISLGGNSDSGLFGFALIKGAKEGTDSGYLAFGTRTAAAYSTERMRITSAGRVGIGTTNPAHPLSILTLNGNEAALELNQTGQNDWIIMNPASSTRLDIVETATARMTILSGGNVGIGTTSPSSTFHVNGGAQIGAPTGGDKGSGTINVAGNYYVSGTALPAISNIPLLNAANHFTNTGTTIFDGDVNVTAGKTLAANAIDKTSGSTLTIATPTHPWVFNQFGVGQGYDTHNSVAIVPTSADSSDGVFLHYGPVAIGGIGAHYWTQCNGGAGTCGGDHGGVSGCHRFTVSDQDRKIVALIDAQWTSSSSADASIALTVNNLEAAAAASQRVGVRSFVSGSSTISVFFAGINDEAGGLWQSGNKSGVNAEFEVTGIGTTVGTGGLDFKGSGTINVSGGIYKNGAAYTNPDYVFEHHRTGKIVRLAEASGAWEYKGLRPLNELRDFIRGHDSLPLMAAHRDGDLFERGELMLASLEEAYLYIFQLEHRLAAVEGACNILA